MTVDEMKLREKNVIFIFLEAANCLKCVIAPGNV